MVMANLGQGELAAAAVSTPTKRSDKKAKEGSLENADLKPPTWTYVSHRTQAMRLTSNNILMPANIGVALLSSAVLASSAWLASNHRYDCFSFLPFMVGSLLLFLIALLGLAASSRRSTPLLLIYALLLALGSLLLAALAIFAMAVAAPAPSTAQEMQYGKIREYRTTHGFSPWLQGKVEEGGVQKIRGCVWGKCAAMAGRYKSLAALYFSGTVTEVEAGCCKPPTRCGFSWMGNATDWEAETEAALQRRSYIRDCAAWGNNPARLCFACDACRAAILYQVRRHWLVVGCVSLAAMALLLVLALLAGVTLRSLRSRSLPDDPPEHKQSPFI